MTEFHLARHDIGMADRTLKIAKLIGSTPSLGYCDLCKLTFRTRPEFIVDPEKAKQQLMADFEKHECRPEPEAVDDALIHIK